MSQMQKEKVGCDQSPPHYQNQVTAPDQIPEYSIPRVLSMRTINAAQSIVSNQSQTLNDQANSCSDFQLHYPVTSPQKLIMS